MKTVFAAAAFLLAGACFSQDSTREWTFRKEIMYWSKWQNHPIDAAVAMPDFLRTDRQNRNAGRLPTSYETITDNPLRHGATYVTLKMQSTYKNRVTIFADLYAEHRGVSYGVFSRNNTALYPVVRVEARDTLKLGKQAVAVSGKAGQFVDEQLDEGLAIDNIDLQGFQFGLQRNGLSLQYTQYGDLNNGIGLNIDDVSHIALKKAWGHKAMTGVSWMISRPPFYPLRNHYSLNAFGNIAVDAHKFYAQLGYRPYRISSTFFSAEWSKQLAALIGWRWTRQGQKFQHTIAAEVRYYGFVYNLGYTNWDTVLYRRPAADIQANYANTTGNYLYPLRKFETPFGQWAVFTEYQGFNVGAGTVRGSSVFRAAKSLEAFIKYDLNFIHAYLDPVWSGFSKRESSFFYPFVTTGLAYLPAENTQVKVAVTNKAINLDINYPTHYLLKKLCFELSLLAHFE